VILLSRPPHRRALIIDILTLLAAWVALASSTARRLLPFRHGLLPPALLMGIKYLPPSGCQLELCFMYGSCLDLATFEN
jgi:hypothetical protein